MDEFLKKIAAIFEVDELTALDDMESFAEWDSLSVLLVIAMIDADYKVNLQPKDLAPIKTLGELWQVVQSRQP
jgi:acyl carrier protein